MNLEHGMILEGVVTTINDDQSVNISPMGPSLNEAAGRLVLRPFPSSTTYRNLLRTREGVLHVTDDVELLARAAVGAVDPPPAMRRAEAVAGWILNDACRWSAFRVTKIDDSQARVVIEAEIVASGRQRDFFGFNRAKHAVIEAAILATRTEFLPADEILADFDRLAPLVEKTGGPAERRAFAFLRRFVRDALDARSGAS